MSSEAGREAVELAAMAGLVLDPWEAFVLEHALSEREDGRWAAFEVALLVARQNGKGAILEARELAGLFLLGEQLLIHSAHEFKTSTEHQRRLEGLIQNTPDLHKRVKKNGYRHSHGEEGIELRNGQRIRFMTRTKSGGRGLTGDLVVLDEAMILNAAAIGALMPTMAARSVIGNPQLWYAGSAVDQMVHEHGRVLAALRERGIAGDDPSLAFFEYSAHVGPPEQDHPDTLVQDVPLSAERWAEANPGLGIRITAEHIANEQRSMDPRTFAVERLGVGDWPNLSDDGAIISVKAWLELINEVDPKTLTGKWFAFDVSPDRSWASIAVAGRRPDGLAQVELVERKNGTGWLNARLHELAKTHKPSGIVCDDAGPAASLLHELDDLTAVEVVAMNAKEYAQACGLLQDAVEQETIRHLGQPEITAALRGAATRPLTDKWAWARRPSSGDITSLVAVTLAHGKLATAPAAKEPVVVWA